MSSNNKVWELLLYNMIQKYKMELLLLHTSAFISLTITLLSLNELTLSQRRLKVTNYIQINKRPSFVFKITNCAFEKIWDIIVRGKHKYNKSDECYWCVTKLGLTRKNGWWCDFPCMKQRRYLVLRCDPIA